MTTTLEGTPQLLALPYCSPVLTIRFRQLLLEVLETKPVAASVQTEAASADDRSRWRTGLE